MVFSRHLCWLENTAENSSSKGELNTIWSKNYRSWSKMGPRGLSRNAYAWSGNSQFCSRYFAPRWCVTNQVAKENQTIEIVNHIKCYLHSTGKWRKFWKYFLPKSDYIIHCIFISFEAMIVPDLPYLDDMEKPNK